MPHDDAHLSQISTQWTLVFQAHQGRTEEVATAQVALMMRYAGAVHRYLLGALGDPDVAADLDQEFALRFLRGDFHRADRSRGRFRDFVKRSLRNLVIDHHRSLRRKPLALPEGEDPPAPAAAWVDAFDRRFTESWRKELMARAWARLEEQGRAGRPDYTVLRHRVDHPDLRSPALAEGLSERLGRPVNAAWVRQALRAARDRFVGLILDEVRSSLDTPTRDDLESELIELGLLEYCRPALERRRNPPARREETP